MHTHMYTHTHIYIHAYTHTYTHAYTYTHTHTHLHTHRNFFLPGNEGGTSDSKARLCPKGWQRLWGLTVWLLACGECDRFVHFKTK